MKANLSKRLRSMNSDERLEYWNAQAQAALVGHTITFAGYMTDEQMQDYGVEQRYLYFVLSDGSVWVVVQDDEGNGPGTLHRGDASGRAPTILPEIYW